ncbi:MAG: hypothetical protein VB949_10835 [Pseudomonadales bacterium]
MADKTEQHPWAGHSGPHRMIFSILLIASVSGCAAMEGVDVGANIPIGGIISVGAHKTIGDRPAPAPTQKKPLEKPEETATQ